jgi:S-adenosylmethionine hydrolase
MTRPIVFLTDYGYRDPFVGTCHGVIARIAPDTRVIDLTHAVPRQDVLRGAVELARSIPYMPTDAVFVAVVDPGVGSDRREVALVAGPALMVGPDNGVLSLAAETLGGVDAAVEISSEEVVLSPVSRTFHGRDVFAPAAAHLAAGMALEELGPAVDPSSLQRLEDAGVADGRVLVVNGRRLPRAGTFAELPEREPGIIVDSEGYLAIVVNHGNAATALGLAAGDAVVVESG